MQVLALFGPTAVGKTGVAIAVAEALRGSARTRWLSTATRSRSTAAWRH